MFRLYSKSCEYVIRALASVNTLTEGRFFSVKDICKKARLPEWYTRKVFQSLVRRGYLEAFRGPGGGYQFKVSPKKISVLNIIKAVDGDNFLDQCVMGPGKCNGRKTCGLHNKLKKIKVILAGELKSISLQDMMDLGFVKDNPVSTLKKERMN